MLWQNFIMVLRGVNDFSYKILELFSNEKDSHRHNKCFIFSKGNLWKQANTTVKKKKRNQRVVFLLNFIIWDEWSFTTSTYTTDKLSLKRVQSSSINLHFVFYEAVMCNETVSYSWRRVGKLDDVVPWMFFLFLPRLFPYCFPLLFFSIVFLRFF